MRTSLNEIKQIEDYLLGELDDQEAVVFDANLIINAELATNVELQMQGYEVIKAYGRRQLKKEIETVQQQLFNEEEHQSFREKIFSIFRQK